MERRKTWQAVTKHGSGFSLEKVEKPPPSANSGVKKKEKEEVKPDIKHHWESDMTPD